MSYSSGYRAEAHTAWSLPPRDAPKPTKSDLWKALETAFVRWTAAETEAHPLPTVGGTRGDLSRAHVTLASERIILLVQGATNKRGRANLANAVLAHDGVLDPDWSEVDLEAVVGAVIDVGTAMLVERGLVHEAHVGSATVRAERSVAKLQKELDAVVSAEASLERDVAIPTNPTAGKPSFRRPGLLSQSADRIPSAWLPGGS